MRLWHKDLIPVLPRQQLLSQWRECCCIAKNIAEHGTPNHILVNKIMRYPLTHFRLYAILISNEMEERGYKCDFSKFIKHLQNFEDLPTYDDLYKYWHDKRYLKQCFFNLQEKYDCKGITEDEWKKICDFMINHSDHSDIFF